jgi:hypothetical protein
MAKKRFLISEIFDDVVDLLGEQVQMHQAGKELLSGRDMSALVHAAIQLQAEERAMVGKSGKVADGALRDLLLAELRRDPELWADLRERMDAERAQVS